MIAALDPNELKRAAAARALEYVESGMKLGLGTGSTAEIFLELLAEGMRGGLKIVGTATSERAAVVTCPNGIPSTGRGKAPRRSLSLLSSPMTTQPFDGAAATFSRSTAPPPPLTRS